MKADFLILVVDDDLSTIDFLRHTAQHSFPEAHFIQVHNSVDAKAYFDNVNNKVPKLIFLDLYLRHEQNGFDFLTFLRGTEKMRSLPVILFTVSQSESDILAAYSFSGVSYSHKPFGLWDWKMYLGSLRNYWYNTVTLPPAYSYK